MKNGKDRLNLALPRGAKEKLEILQKKSGSATASEVVRRSLALFELVLDHNGEITVFDDSGKKKIIRVL